MSLKRRIIALLAALVLVEIASYWKLSHFLFWGHEPWLAYTSAAAFVGLLLVSIVALGSHIPEGMRQRFYAAGTWLFAVQALANVLLSYERSQAVLPVDVVSGFFGVGPEVAVKSMAIIQGATLSVTSLCFWQVLGFLLQQLDNERTQRREQLKDLERIRKEVGK